MCEDHNESRKRQMTERIERQNPEKIRTLVVMANYIYQLLLEPNTIK